MDIFLLIISSFPTAIYTTGLLVVLGYWVLAIIGMVDIELFDIGLDIDIDTEVDSIGGVAGLLLSLGLTGVPITIVISLLVLNGWIACYFIALVMPDLPELLSVITFLINIGIFIISFAISIFVTAIMIRPLKGLFKKLNQTPVSRSLLGISCKVRSSRVDSEFGEADCSHDGASLLIKVRSSDNEVFKKGDIVTIIEHNSAQNTFLVVSDQTFKQNLNNTK